MRSFALTFYYLLFLFYQLRGGDVIEYHSQEHSARYELSQRTDLIGDYPVNEA